MSEIEDKPPLMDLVDAGHEPTTARLREAVAYAAKRGSQFGKQRRSNRNPHFKPNLIGRDILWIIGRSREIAEILQNRSGAELWGGCDSDRERERLLTAAREGHAALARLLAAADAPR